MSRVAADLSHGSHGRIGKPTLLSADTIEGDDVHNRKDEKLGTIQDLMLDIESGKVRYAVLSSGGFLGMGDRLFAIPWNALQIDHENKRFTLDVDIDRLKDAPGFDKDNWPDWSDTSWSSSVDSYYQSPHAATR